MEELILFLISFVFIFMVYQLLVVSKAKRNSKKKKNKREPVEVTYLVTKYKLDIKKVNYNQLLQIIALVSSFDIALIVSLVMIVNNFFLRLLIALVATIIIILVSYHLVYLFYKKKGMIKNV